MKSLSDVVNSSEDCSGVISSTPVTLWSIRAWQALSSAWQVLILYVLCINTCIHVSVHHSTIHLFSLSWSLSQPKKVNASMAWLPFCSQQKDRLWHNLLEMLQMYIPCKNNNSGRGTPLTDQQPCGTNQEYPQEERLRRGYEHFTILPKFPFHLCLYLQNSLENYSHYLMSTF